MLQRVFCWRCFLLAALLASSPPASAWAGKDPAPKTILDTWDVAYMGGGRAGYVHTYVNEYDMNGQKIFAAVTELRLNVKRFGDPIQLSMDSGTFETDKGQVVGTLLRQYLGKQRQAEIIGMVKDGMLHLKLDKNKQLEPAPWNNQVIGLFRQQSLFKEHQLKPGDQFNYLSFEPTINLVLGAKVEAKDFEMVETAPGKAKQKLLRVVTKPDKIEKVQLPPLIQWVNADYAVVRSQIEVPGLGRIFLFRSDKAGASGPLGQLTDIGINQLVKLKSKIAQPYETASATYRIHIEDEDEPATAFSQDERQHIKVIKGSTIELRVQAGRGMTKGKEEKIGPEFLQSSYFITSADVKVKALARQAVGKQTDPWKKALAIEKWVHDHMKGTSYEALAPADQVARNLQGDCTEYAMLAAAMCRAEGVPSRTAMGLIYADIQGKPAFSFHMWTEVAINNRWVPLDATLGKGYVGATHLKVTDHSWHDIRTMTPLFPVLRVVDRLAIEVVGVDP